MAMVLTVFSPKCWATSRTRRGSRPVTFKAFKISGSPSSNCWKKYKKMKTWIHLVELNYIVKFPRSMMKMELKISFDLVYSDAPPVVYFDQRLHACACLCMVENNKKTLKNCQNTKFQMSTRFGSHSIADQQTVFFIFLQTNNLSCSWRKRYFFDDFRMF